MLMFENALGQEEGRIGVRSKEFPETDVERAKACDSSNDTRCLCDTRTEDDEYSGHGEGR